MARDLQTPEFLKLWGPKSVPTAKVTLGSVRPGWYPAFALLGWIEARKDWPIVGLQLALLRPGQDKSTGGLTMGLPLSQKTEGHVCGLLMNLGWDGRVWPHKDHGWPEGTQDEASIIGLLKNAKLGATLTFQSDPEKGAKTVQVYVAKSHHPFHTAPFRGTTSEHLAALRVLAADPTPFKSDWLS